MYRVNDCLAVEFIKANPVPEFKCGACGRFCSTLAFVLSLCGATCLLSGAFLVRIGRISYPASLFSERVRGGLSALRSALMAE